MISNLFRVSSILAVLVCIAPSADARFRKYWSQEELFRESNLVVIAEAVKSEISKDTFPSQFYTSKASFEGIITVFKVNLVLKGNESAKSIRVLHFKLRPGSVGIFGLVDGPCLVSFATELVEVSFKGGTARQKPSYLLFLKKKADGRYEPVTGQVDPDDSVREMYSPFAKE
jgi:hypothetical protein